jgi:hypothetical protein
MFNKFDKNGVSLITVLLFMLIATIAATTTFKWLTSENRSSASRMEIQEARQSALAGIQSTRAWVTHNANDVGAVIRQYILGGRQPISLKNRVSAQINSKQQFNVWLAGVSEVNGFFKLKILSEGIARNNSKHTEVAILNVSGLYQVSPPEEEVTVKSIVYDYSYFGGTVRNNGNAKLSSMLINGNWYGNPIDINKNLIITGNSRLTGNNVYIHGTGCFGGDLNADNGIDAENIFVGGSAKKFGTKYTTGVARHAYFDGVVEQDENRKIRIGGNMTANNYVKTHMGNGTSLVSIEGNLCLGTSAQVQIGAMQGTSLNYNQSFKVDGDVWITHPNSFYARDPNYGDFHEYYDKIILGNKSTSNVYIKDAYPYENYVALRTAKTFVENSDYRQHCSNPVSSGDGSFGCYNKNSSDAGRHDHQWDYWHDDSKTPYTYVAPNSDMYYFYYVEPGLTDVEFKEYNNNYWQNKTSGTWNSPTAIGAYHVGGNVFYQKNATETWNEYNYGTDAVNRYGIGAKKRSPYCLKGNDKFRPECHVSPWFKSKGTVKNEIPSTKAVACADSVKQVCDDIWEKTPGCDGATYKVKDILKTAYDVFKPYANKGCAHDITEMNQNFAKDLNKCYQENNGDESKKANLYNGYLVVEVESKELVQNYGEDLKGKFIIILKKKPSAQVVFPATAGDKDFAFVYLTEGATTVQGLDGKTYNYFIYTPADVGTSTTTYTSEGVNIQPIQDGFLFNNAYFHGSIYAVAKNCAKISSIAITTEMKFNQELLNSLNEARIICDISVANCGGAEISSSSAAPGSSSSDSESSINGKDPYFIAIAPQLGVTLESQYKSSEPVPNEAADATPSILVLPRIVYLTKDPAGTLADYYSVVNLNGANEVKDANNVYCNGIPTTGVLYIPGNHLYNGTYTCQYNSTNYGSVPFYVVVTNSSGELPEVFFENSQQALNLGESATVSVKVGKANNASGLIKFDFSVSTEYPGWTITPKSGVTERTGGGASDKRYFSVQVTPNASEDQTVELLTISTTDDATDGDIYITLTPPLELCRLVGSKSSHHVFAMGHTFVNRGSIKDYCENYSDCSDSDRKKAEYLDCDYDGEWITVNGSGCTAIVKNDRWSCLTTSSISLETINADDIPSNCEIVFPEEHNAVSEPQSGSNYYLYASLKRKKVELTVDFENAKDENSYIRVYDQATMEENRCGKSESPCTYKIVAGAPIIISHVDYGDDREAFDFWACTGENCPSSSIRDNESEFRFLSPHTVVAKYNQESHCYYDDFANTNAFCDAGGEDCIDTCATVLSSSQACRPKNSKQPKSNWLLTYRNNGTGSSAGYMRPVFGAGSIFAPSDADRVSVILRNKNAGPYGTMNALVQTSILGSANPNEFLNTGFIFRSNGDEHLVLNVYGVGLAGKNTGNLTFRVCKVVGQSISNAESNCKVVPKKAGLPDIAISSNNFIKLAFTIDTKDLLTIRASSDDKVWEGEVSVKDFGFNDVTHTYVGFSFENREFKIYDNGWTSTSFDDKCWEIPFVTCSFADNYVGETIPLDEDVLPKILMSSWFSEKNCITEYHYNGCDNNTSSCVNGTGSPGEIGAKLDRDVYHFTQEGAHGYLYEEGKKAQDASVKVVCPGDVTSLDLAQEFYSCGAFWVGAVNNCSSDADIYDDPVYLNAGEQREFLISTGTSLNMRSGELHVDIVVDGLEPKHDLDANIEVQLESANGMKSLSRSISTSGVHDISVEVLANTIGFDPQQVTKVFIKSDKSINIKKLKISSKCPNKVELKCKDAKYEWNTRGWEIDIDPIPGKKAKCTFSSSDENITSLEGTECKKQTLTYKEGSYAYAFMGETPNFTVTAEDNNGNTKSCTIKGSSTGNYTPICSIPEDMQTINAGDQAPEFKFNVGTKMGGVGWNNFSANYKVYLGDDVVKEGSATIGEEQTVSANIQPVAGEHTYKVEIWFGNNNAWGWGQWTQTCTASFSVEENTQKEKPTIDCANSSVDENGTFSVSVSNPDNVSYHYTFGVTDPLGVVFEGLNGSSTETSLSYTYSPGVAGTYVYTFMAGESSCSKNLTVTSPIKMTACPSVTDQDNEQIIAISPTVEGCIECSYKIYDGSIEKSTDLSFYDVNGSGKKTYKLQATDKFGNTAACNFSVTFRSQNSNEDIVELVYQGSETLLDVGTHKVKCKGENVNGDKINHGRLICKCPITQWDYYNCKVEVNGKMTELISQSGFQSVDGENDRCYDDKVVTVKVYAPGPYKNLGNDNNGKVHEQSNGVYCRHDW